MVWLLHSVNFDSVAIDEKVALHLDMVCAVGRLSMAPNDVRRKRGSVE